MIKLKKRRYQNCPRIFRLNLKVINIEWRLNHVSELKKNADDLQRINIRNV